MKIEKDMAVGFHYTLTDENGETLDSSKDREPMVYLHGHPGIIPGLERAMQGHEVGDEFNAVIPPEDAYGIYSDGLVRNIDLSHFENPEHVVVGAQFQVQAGNDVHVATVTEIEDEIVTLDLNHPLANQTLHFEVKIDSVRKASAEELEHGHIHGEGGHHH